MGKAKNAGKKGQTASAAKADAEAAAHAEQELAEATSAAALLEETERKAAEKPPPLPPRGLVWTELSEEDMKMIRTLEGPHSIAKFLSKHFGLHDLLFKDIAASAINDLTLHATLFALESGFTDEQCSALVSIVKKVTQYAMGRTYLADRVTKALSESEHNPNIRQASQSDSTEIDTAQELASKLIESEQGGTSKEQEASTIKENEVAATAAEVPVESDIPPLPTTVDMLPSLAESFALFRKLALQHSVSQPPDSHEIFSFEEVQAIVEFLKSNLFVAFEAYQSLSVHASETEMLPVTKVVVQTPLLPGILLQDAVSTEVLTHNNSNNQDADEKAVLAGVPGHLRALVEQLVELELKPDQESTISAA